MICLRYYQSEAIAAIYAYFTGKAGNPIVAMPTGTGKSLVIAGFTKSVFDSYPGQKLLMLTHVKELIEQNFEKLVDLWPMAPAGVYSAGLRRREVRPITFAGIASVCKKPDLFGHIDLVLVDECHLISPNYATTYRKFIDELLKVNPYLKVVGFSATPYRLGQGLLTHDIPEKNGTIKKALFNDVCYDICGFESFNRLVAEGYIAPLTTKKADKEIDLTDVRTLAGEFNLADLEEAADKEEVTRKAISEIIAKAEDRKRWLIFSSGVAHAYHIREELVSRGIEAYCVEEGTDHKTRKNVIEWFKAPCSGRIRALVNNGIFSTGFDCPQIDLIGCLFATQSPGKWVQILGRGTRPADGKANCLVLDFGGNAARLGPINDPKLPRPKGSKGGGEAPVRLCVNCSTYNHASARICCECGQPFPEAVKIAESAGTSEVMASDVGLSPIVEIFPVTNIEYSRHISRRHKIPDSLKVTYWTGPARCFSEYICFEHDSFARQKAKEWWLKRSHYNVPVSVSEALAMQVEIAEPTHIRVWVNGPPYAAIKDYDFEGTAFGTLGKVANLPKIKAVLPGSLLDEDVPF